MSHPLKIEVQPSASSVTLLLAGELDLATASTLRDCLEDLDGSYREVVLDCTGLTFLDSSGLGVIARANEKFGPELRELTIKHPPENVRNILAISGIDQIVTVVF